MSSPVSPLSTVTRSQLSGVSVAPSATDFQALPESVTA
jgi:hypothetical protein